MGKELRERLHQVDPSLTIVGGMTRRHWEATEVYCPYCGEVALRLDPERGVCPRCASSITFQEEKAVKKYARVLKAIKKHNDRIDRQRRRSGK